MKKIHEEPQQDSRKLKEVTEFLNALRGRQLLETQDQIDQVELQAGLLKDHPGLPTKAQSPGDLVQVAEPGHSIIAGIVRRVVVIFQDLPPDQVLEIQDQVAVQGVREDHQSLYQEVLADLLPGHQAPGAVEEVGKIAELHRINNK